jgi:Uma2 family endonuclease
MSPRRRHARLQGLIFASLDRWAERRGDVGTEWRFRLSERPESETSLVPDVAYVSGDRLGRLDDATAEEPPFAPDIAVEIRSPGDRERNIRAKIGLYLEFGAMLVLDVDPERRQIVAHDPRGKRAFAAGETFSHPAAPGFTLDVATLFAAADRGDRGAPA